MKITVLGLCGRSVFLGVDHFHAPGETVHARHLYAEPGGKGFNQAVAAARLGAQAAFITCTGDDEDGRQCLACLEQEGVETAVQICPDRSTAYACILTDQLGENRVTVYRGAADALSPEHIRRCGDLIAGSDMLLLNNEYPHSCNLAALALAERYGVPVLLNPAPPRESNRELLQRLFLVTPNLSEAAVLFGGMPNSAAELAVMARRSGVRRAVVTLGGDGALLIDGDRALKYPAVRCAVRDTTGAGDVFTAALAVGVLNGRPLESAVEFAVNAAAISVTKQYVLPGLPTRAQVEADYTGLAPEKVE